MGPGNSRGMLPTCDIRDIKTKESPPLMLHLGKLIFTSPFHPPLLLLFTVAILKSVKVLCRCWAQIKSAYHVLHLLSSAKSPLILSDPNKPFSLAPGRVFSPCLLTLCDLRALPKAARCSDIRHSTDLGQDAAVPW